MVKIVSKRYYMGMVKSSEPSRRMADLIVHIGRRAAAGEGGGALTPAQWSALRYFSHANRFSRTPSAFASFQATTRGTASATVNALVQGGYLLRQRSADDRRSVSLEPSEAGNRLLEQDPLLAMERAFNELPPEQQRSLAAAIPSIASRMAEADGGAAFGNCHECCHLARSDSHDCRPYYCQREAAPLGAGELDGLCAYFEPVNRS